MVVSAIRDRVADRYLGLDLTDNDKLACRNFVFTVFRINNDAEHFLINAGDDLELWYLGRFDQETGVFYDTENAHILMLGVQARKELKNYEQESEE